MASEVLIEAGSRSGRSARGSNRHRRCEGFSAGAAKGLLDAEVVRGGNGIEISMVA
jgi:hypothetical protein